MKPLNADQIFTTLNPLAPSNPVGRALSRKGRLTAEVLVVLYIAAIALAANVSRIPYLLFPEMGALVYDLLTRPWGKWASQPVRLFVTPAITALAGTLITRYVPFNLLSVAIIVLLSVGVIAVLRSAITPAMSAGLLPLVLGVKSWLYPISILATLTALSLISVIWRRYHPARSGYVPSGEVEDVLESLPKGKMWLAVLIAFALIMTEAARLSGWRFLLFPPLVTMAYEMFGHPRTCAWMKRPITLPLACSIVACGGLAAERIFGTGIAMAIISVVIGIAVLRIFDLHMPPALAIGLLPAVITAPDFTFPLAVLAATLCLTGAFLLYQRVLRINGST